MGDIIGPSTFRMGSTIVKSESTDGGVEAADIRQELDRISASPVFRGSRRCQSFIQYVVTKTLEGDANTLKERTLAIEVFGRHESEDLADDSIVRVGAREVRKRLAQYYVDEGAHDSVRIELPAGSYIPSFHYQGVHHPEPAIATTVSPLVKEAAVLSPHSAGWRKLLLASAIVVVCLVGLFAWRFYSAPISLFDLFWRPAFAAKTGPAILIAHPIVYQPSTRASRLDEQMNGASLQQRIVRVPASMLDGSDYVPSVDHFVGFGDAEAALRISSMLVKHHLDPTVRLASRMDFYDLRQASAVLIGAFTNRWVMELTKNMPYRFGYRQGMPCIQEGSDGCRWTLTTKADNGKSSEDYILICRLPHPQTSGFVVIVAGLNVYGTEEAGRIVSDPESLAPILKRLPPHWADHNLGLVLHGSVVGDAPAQSEMVSVHTW